MKTRNNIPYYLPKIFLAMAAFLLLNSCTKFLDVEPPKSRVSNEQVFSSDVIANSAMVGIYLDMYLKGFADGSTTGIVALAGLSADELHYYNNLTSDPSMIAFEANNILVDNAQVLNLWISMYKSIYQANAMIEGLSASSNVTAPKKDQLKGECLFIRAFCHFYLVNVFGDVPLITATDYTSNSKVLRTPQSQVYNQVETDLLEAENLLPEAYGDGGLRIRPVKAVASALLARLYLYKTDWQKAEEYASKIINNTGVYHLEDSVKNVFLSSSREAIWQLKPQDKADYTQDGYSFSPSVALQNNVLTDTLVHSFQTSDKRKANWITTTGAIYLPYKYKLYLPSGQASTEYSMVFRLAEQHLIRAEARAHLNMFSGSESSQADINIIRRRAGLPDTSFNNLEDAQRIIEKERKLELFTEWGHRWFDLKRWGRATEVLSPLKPGWTANDTLYPIPQEEMNRNPFLTPQNPGYQ